LVRGTRNHAIKLRPIVVINADVVHDNVVDLPIPIFAFHQIDDRNLIAIFANHLRIDGKESAKSVPEARWLRSGGLAFLQYNTKKGKI
jgi:hypothetical protein